MSTTFERLKIILKNQYKSSCFMNPPLFPTKQSSLVYFTIIDCKLHSNIIRKEILQCKDIVKF